MKKLATLIITTILLTTTVYGADIKIQVGDYEIIPPVPPVVKNGTTLVPLRVISEALGAYVSWDKESNSVTVLEGNTKLYLIIGDTTMVKTSLNSGEETPISLALPATQTSGTTLVPLRAISEGLGCITNYANNVITLIPQGTTTAPTIPPTGTTSPDEVTPSFTSESGKVILDHLTNMYSSCNTMLGDMTMEFKVTVNEDKAPYHPCDFEVVVTLSEQSKNDISSLTSMSPDSASYVYSVLRNHMQSLATDITSIYPTAKFMGYYDLTSYKTDGGNMTLVPNYTCSWINFSADAGFTYKGSSLSTFSWFTSYDTYEW